MEYIFLFKYICSSSWKLPVKEELSRNNVLKGVAEAWKASQPRTVTDGAGAEGAEGKQTGEREKCCCRGF